MKTNDMVATPIGRLAFRREGDDWVVYFAPMDSMEGAVRLGSILFTTIFDNDERREAFVSLMRGVLEDVTGSVTGKELSWSATTKPEKFDG